MASQILAHPTTKYYRETRHVSLSRRHAGQIVTPVVRAWHRGQGYLVQLSWFDAADRTYSDPLEFSGNFWACTAWLAGQGVSADIDAA